MDEIVGEFVIESLEGLDRLDQALVFLEETPDDTQTITEIFRILHTIKGTCGFLAFQHLEKVAHRGENLLSLLRDSVLYIDGDITNALLATVDAIRAILETIEQTGEEGEPDNAAVIAELERLSARADHNPEQEPPRGAPNADLDSEAPAESAGLEPAVASAADPLAPTESPAVESPAVEPLDPAVADPAVADPALAESAVADPETDAEIEPAAQEPAVPPSPPAERLGDILVSDAVAKRDDVEIAAAEQALGDSRPIGKILTDQGKARAGDVEKAVAKQTSSADSTIRVDVDLLNQLMNLVGELVLSRNQIIQLSDSGDSRDFAAPAQRLNQITSELQEGVMKTRMQPIGNIWGKLPRVVRDLSRQLGKQIRLEMEGKDTELDRTIIEAIKDPLTHMVRNTVDHGIESPEDRVAAGKPSEGVLLLRANHEGGQVNIEIADDGAGIDADIVRRKAVEKELITAEAAEKLSDNEAVQLVFMAGFSTAVNVSNVSGRGVGMDVVRSNIERIGGSVDIKTVRGAGTTFKIKIPLTLAIIPALTVRCGTDRYAIPQMSLLELLRLEGDDPANKIEDVHGAPVYRLRGRLLPIVYLQDQLNTTSTLHSDDQSVVRNIVVLQADDRQFGLVVDEIEDTEEIVVKPLGRAVQQISLFSGATIMGDGTVSLILDVLGLATEANILGAGSRHAEVHADTSDQATGDSTTARMLLFVKVSEDTKVAIPLDEVERLEEFAVADIERSDNHSVVQYRNSVMALHEMGDLIGCYGGGTEDRERVSVVVCTKGSESVGFIVDRVLDIVPDATINTGVGDGPETALIGNKIIDLVDMRALVGRFLHTYEETPIGANA